MYTPFGGILRPVSRAESNTCAEYKNAPGQIRGRG